MAFPFSFCSGDPLALPTGHGHSKHSGKGQKGVKGHSDHSGHKSKKFGKKHEDHWNKHSKAKGKHSKGHHDSKKYHGDHFKGNKGHKGAKFGKKGHKHKGHVTKGFKNTYHKNEFSKKTKFYDSFDDGGYHKKYGGYNGKYGGSKGNKFKGGKLSGFFKGGKFGKKHEHEKGSHFDDHKGHKGHFEEKGEHGHKSTHGGGHDHGYGHSRLMPTYVNPVNVLRGSNNPAKRVDVHDDLDEENHEEDTLEEANENYFPKERPKFYFDSHRPPLEKVLQKNHKALKNQHQNLFVDEKDNEDIVEDGSGYSFDPKPKSLSDFPQKASEKDLVGPRGIQKHSERDILQQVLDYFRNDENDNDF